MVRTWRLDPTCVDMCARGYADRSVPSRAAAGGDTVRADASRVADAPVPDGRSPARRRGTLGQERPPDASLALAHLGKLAEVGGGELHGAVVRLPRPVALGDARDVHAGVVAQ